ncbi:unnamed protein product [Cladocopium goreaui]|uniref:EGF-like domain-containing protein n=1 Tax=Cladocopium goreaui TaxID=2562237 RepID=A0A9P1FF45_9DINO|nr:unnamed protein product [Cladocopium goreaui]
MVAVTLRALPLLPYIIDATQAKLSPKGDSSFYTTNPICNKKNCVNPFSPGLMDLPRLENLIWQCSPSGEVQKYVSFCKDAIDYDAAVPTNNVTAPINKIVLSQDSAASTMFFYHLNGLGYDAWEFKKPEEFEDPCVRSVYKLSCMTYFPKNQAGCKTGSQIPFMRPCRNACGSYLDQCKVECCDASTQCVFAEDTASGIKQSGYFNQDGPSAFCTGGATRMSPSLLLLFLLGWHALPERRFLFGSKHIMAVALLFCACNLQGCSLFIPSHRVPNWRKEADYLVQYEFVPEGQPESAATLNSCRSAVPGDKVCSGRGQCKPWSHAPLKVDAWPATYTAFCECDYHWADPECGTRRKSQIKAFLISLFFGIFGLDRFYLGFFYTGLAKLVTLGGLGFWWIYDLVRIGAAPTYALNYKVAADLPHWLFMSIVVLLFTALGLLWSLDSYGRLRKKRRSEAMQFMAEGNEPLKKDDEPLNAWGGKWHGGYGSLPDYPSAHAPYVTRSA